MNQEFTGQERDPETGLDFFHARYFAGVTGRFMSPDPGNAGADLLNPQSWNVYAYVSGDPMGNVDPSGRSCLTTDSGSQVDDGDGQGCGGAGVKAGDPDSSDTLNQGQVNATVSDSGDVLYNASYFQRRDEEFTAMQNRSPGPRRNGLGSQPAKNRFTKLFLPPNANVCFDNQNYFYAPPTFDMQKIEAVGKDGGWSPQAMNAAVGQYGTFDFQRTRDNSGNTTFYSGYTPVSNFSVGAYLYSAGFSKSVASFIANTFALFRSSHAGDPAQATFRNLGYDTAARGQVLACQTR